MFKVFPLLLWAITFVLLTACHHSKGDADYSGLTLCPEVRPQICTREYRPVCATLADGKVKTYSTGCTSCADSNVVGYVASPC